MSTAAVSVGPPDGRAPSGHVQGLRSEPRSPASDQGQNSAVIHHPEQRQTQGRTCSRQGSLSRSCARTPTSVRTAPPTPSDTHCVYGRGVFVTSVLEIRRRE